jgi:hypothetical protein
MENKTNMITIGIVTIVVGITFFVYWYWWSTKETVLPENTNIATEQAAPPETFVVPPSANPLDEVLPPDNPIEKTNPFEYENPFE